MQFEAFSAVGVLTRLGNQHYLKISAHMLDIIVYSVAIRQKM